MRGERERERVSQFVGPVSGEPGPLLLRKPSLLLLGTPGLLKCEPLGTSSVLSHQLKLLAGP